MQTRNGIKLICASLSSDPFAMPHRTKSLITMINLRTCGYSWPADLRAWLIRVSIALSKNLWAKRSLTMRTRRDCRYVIEFSPRANEEVANEMQTLKWKLRVDSGGRVGLCTFKHPILKLHSWNENRVWVKDEGFNPPTRIVCRSRETVRRKSVLYHTN